MSKKHVKTAPFCKTCNHTVYVMKTHVLTEEHLRNARKTGVIGKHVIGQCNTADFRYLEHLSTIIARGEEVDLSNLSNKQKMAVLVLKHFNDNEVSFNVLLKIREVIIWDLNPGKAFEYKLLDPRDKEIRSVLRSMTAGGRY